MKFGDVIYTLFRGSKIKLPEWEGYWEWDAEKRTVMMHCNKDTVIDIRNSDDMMFTLTNIAREDWQYANATNTELLKNETFSSQEALVLMVKGEKVRRKAWSSGVYLFLKDNISTIHLADGTEQEYQLSILDVSTVDWVMYDD